LLVDLYKADTGHTYVKLSSNLPVFFSHFCQLLEITSDVCNEYNMTV